MSIGESYRAERRGEEATDANMTHTLAILKKEVFGNLLWGRQGNAGQLADVHAAVAKDGGVAGSPAAEDRGLGGSREP